MKNDPLLEGPRAVLRRAAARLAEASRPGDVIALVGGLGAGKTFFTQCLARALRVPAKTRVTSPTFVLVHRYEQGRMPLVHADLYRLSDPRELDELGLFESALDGLCVVEWPDRFAREFPPGTLWIALERTRPLRRALRLVTPDGLAAPAPHLLEALCVPDPGRKPGLPVRALATLPAR